MLLCCIACGWVWGLFVCLGCLRALGGTFGGLVDRDWGAISIQGAAACGARVKADLEYMWWSRRATFAGDESSHRYQENTGTRLGQNPNNSIFGYRNQHYRSFVGCKELLQSISPSIKFSERYLHIESKKSSGSPLEAGAVAVGGYPWFEMGHVDFTAAVVCHGPV